MIGLDLMGASEPASAPAEVPLVEAEAIKVQSKVAAISKYVSPWLWVFSLTAFAMSVSSWRKIHAMYGTHENMKRALLPGYDGGR